MHLAANLALLLAVVAFGPSAGAFTPAIFLSALAALLAVFCMLHGYVRRGLIALYFACSAAIVSPLMFNVTPPDRWLVALPVFGALLAASLLWHFKRHPSRA